MSGKRSLKKQLKRQASALAQLEELYRRGTDVADSADDELLTRAAELGADLAASPFAAKWAEVADRALRQSLAGADLGRLDRLLRSLRRNGPPRPLVVLAKAVLDLAAGRLDEARASLAKIGGIGGRIGKPGEIPQQLLADLQALARDEPEQPRKDDYRRAAVELFASLQALEAQASAPTAADRETLTRRLRTLRGLAPASEVDLSRLLDGADRCLALLADLAALESRLPEEDEAQARQAILDWIGPTGPALGATLGAAVPPLLAPLHHALATGWRSLLERVVARQGSAGLAALWVADPKLLAHHVDLPGGAQGGQEGLRRRAQAQQLLAEGLYGELAELLRSRGRAATDAGDRVTLWSLELWARNHWDDEPEDEDDPDFFPDRSESFSHRTLVRLGEMAGEIGRRLPAEQRAGVAQVLAEELFDLSDGVGFCDHTAGAALSLLEHQPGEETGLGLLLAGVAGAIAGNDPRALRALLARIDRGQRGAAGHLPTPKRLMTQIARENPWALARILDAVRPLFSEEIWPEIAELVAREMGGSFARMLKEASFAVAMENIELGNQVLGAAWQGLAPLRPALGETVGFAAVELAVDCWRPAPPAVEKRLARFLAASPGWDAALAALEVLDRARRPWAPKGLHLTLSRLAEAVIDRLDDRWRLWCDAVPLLATAADSAHVARLETRVRRLLASPEVQGEYREALQAGLQAIFFRKSRDPKPSRSRAKKRKKTGRRPRNAPQIGLDF